MEILDFATNGSLSEFKGREYLLVPQPFSFIVKHGPWQIGSTIIRRAALERAGLFDPSVTLSEDLDLMARVALQGGFGMIRRQLVNIYRRDESNECLTLYATANPVWARKSDDRVYEKLKRIKGLRRRDRKAVSEVMSANRRALGNLLLEKGQIEEAGEWYKRALASYPSIRSLGKYVQFIVAHQRRFHGDVVSGADGGNGQHRDAEKRN